MRRLVKEISSAAGFGEEETGRIVLAMDEACTNVIRHAYGGDTRETIVIEAGPCEGGVCFVVVDEGRKPDPESIRPRALDKVAPGGLGTHFIQAVMDQVTYDTTSGPGTRLTMIKRRKASGEEEERG
jgi:anti-sigma regulatory factor (Ser/Thr protein kinase)